MGGWEANCHLPPEGRPLYLGVGMPSWTKRRIGIWTDRSGNPESGHVEWWDKDDECVGIVMIAFEPFTPIDECVALMLAIQPTQGVLFD